MWEVTARIRQRGAIGIFYNQTFTVSAPPDAVREQIVNAFIAQYGNEWELNHIVSYFLKD
jgi:hypothetical protein